jgi:outer membrane autotransporter protein
MMIKEMVLKIGIVVMSVLMPAVSGAAGDEKSPFSLGYGVVTSTGTDAKSPAPGAVTAKYGLGTDKVFKPYVGAGVAYSPSTPESKPNDPGGGMKTGVAYQFGVDYKLDENSSLNIDYKRLSITPDARRSNDPQPSLLGIGLNFKF